MSENKWTPGPWEAENVDDEPGYWRIGSDDVTWVASIHEDADMVEDTGIGPQLEANARLIAAAPDLYAALDHADETLRLIVQSSPLWAPDLETYAAEAQGKARAALARARGEK